MLADMYDELNYDIEYDFSGYSCDFYISSDTIPLRTDIILSSKHFLKIWGQISTSSALPLCSVIVQLIQVIFENHHFIFSKCVETKTDTNGFYTLEYSSEKPCCYHILILSNHLVNTKIIHPKFNPCIPCSTKLPACYTSFLEYLNINFPNTFGYRHFFNQSNDCSIISTVYSLPFYTE